MGLVRRRRARPEVLFLVSLAAFQFCLFQLWSYHRLAQHEPHEDAETRGSLEHMDEVVRYSYRSMDELIRRSERFPSIEDRLKVYMTSWYSPPMADKDFISYRLFANGTAIIRELSNPHVPSPALIRVGTHPLRNRNLFRLDRQEILRCKEKGDAICKDVADYVLPALNRVAESGTNTAAPILLQFGDAEEWHTFNPSVHTNESYPDVPLIKKFRTALSRSTVTNIVEQLSHSVDLPRHAQPIISIACNYKRHFGPLVDIPEIDTIPWSQKRNASIWRGALTGRNHLRKRFRHNASEICQHIPRCQFVRSHQGSTLVDARLIIVNDAPLPIPRQLNGYDLFAGHKLSMASLLEYKVLIVMEGNDVATGLKWSLFSESIVLMQRPHYTSWAMEELLEPWVHYVPIEQSDFSDVEAKVQWIIDHDEEAQEIVKNARLWIADLVFHPIVEKENQMILDETMRRYQTHFRGELPVAL